MLRFHPAGFVQKPLTTDLGVMVYYTNAEAPAIGTPTLVFLHSLGADPPPLNGLWFTRPWRMPTGWWRRT